MLFNLYNNIGWAYNRGFSLQVPGYTPTPLLRLELEDKKGGRIVGELRYYAKNIAALSACAEARKELAEPKAEVVVLYVANVQRKLLDYDEAVLALVDVFTQ